MRVKIITNYNDKQLKELIKADDILTVGEERGKELINAGVAVELKEETTEAPAGKPAKKAKKKADNAKA